MQSIKSRVINSKGKLSYSVDFAISVRGTSFEPDAPYPVAPVTIDFYGSIEWAIGDSIYPDMPLWADMGLHFNEGKYYTEKGLVNKVEWKRLYGSYRKYIHQSNHNEYIKD